MLRQFGDAGSTAIPVVFCDRPFEMLYSYLPEGYAYTSTGRFPYEPSLTYRLRFAKSNLP